MDFQRLKTISKIKKITGWDQWLIKHYRRKDQ